MRSLGFSPESFHLTTGTFNLVVKDRIAFRLSGAPSVQSRDTQVRPCLSSKPDKVTSCALPVSTHCTHRISTAYPHGNWGSAGTLARDLSAQQNSSSVRSKCHISARADTEDSRIMKDPYGGSCDLRLNPSRSSVPESNSVAGVYLLFQALPIRCRTSAKRFG